MKADRPEEGQIFDAARRLFALQGFVSTSLDQIAQEAGMTTRALLSRYPDKKSVLAGAAEEMILDCLSELKQKIAEAKDEEVCGVVARHLTSNPLLGFARLMTEASKMRPGEQITWVESEQ